MSDLPPGPRYPGTLQTLGWVLRPGPWLEGCRARYGDCFTVRLPGFGEPGFKPVVVIADPAAIKDVFSGGQRFAHVNRSRRVLAPIFGQRSVIVIDGPDHLRRRRMLLPPFHGERLSAYRQLIEEITVREAETWPVGQPFSLQARFQAITLEVILRVVFGVRDSGRYQRAHRAITELLDLVANPFAEVAIGLPDRLGPVEVMAPLGRAKAPVDRILFDEIQHRRHAPDLEEREDILSLMLQARDEDGHGLSDEEIRDDLMSLLLAGHETTATALAWAFVYLMRAPELLAKLVDQCRTSDSTAGVDAVIKETLRLRPPLPITDRVLTEPWRVNGHELPAGTVIAPCVYLVHRHPDLYRQPHEFRPDRFLDGQAETYSWIPFGGGMRRCLGASFASLEMQVVLATILPRFHLRATTSRLETARRRSIVLAPARGAQAVVERITFGGTRARPHAGIPR
jgi:cytochrome P450